MLDDDANRNDLAEFYGCIEYMDKWVGEILDAIKSKNIEEDTLIVFTTDHGAAFMHSKATLYDGGTKVALLCSWKNHLKSNVKFNGLSSHVDILPTICEMVDFDCPCEVQGISQLHGINTGEYAREYSFSEENYNNHFVPGRTVRSKDYRYIKNGIPISIFDFLIPEIELSNSDFRKNIDVFNFYSAKRVTEELYDFTTDKAELINLAENDEYKEILQQYRDVLNMHLSQTNDPFLLFKNDIHMPTSDYELLRDKKLGKL